MAVVCKRGTSLPELPEAERWDEPDEPRHPLTGIVLALEAAGAALLVCAADMPFVTADACRTLIQGAGGSPAVVATAQGVLQPTSGLHARAAPEVLSAAEPDAPLTRTVEALSPARVALPPGLVRAHARWLRVTDRTRPVGEASLSARSIVVRCSAVDLAPYRGARRRALERLPRKMPVRAFVAIMRAPPEPVDGRVRGVEFERR